MKNLVSKKQCPANIFILIFSFFSATVILTVLKAQSNQGSKREEALLFDKIVRKAELLHMVGVPGFEPGASWTRTKRDTKLRHTPKKQILL